jgi:serine/threonine protein phosphatase 1
VSNAVAFVGDVHGNLPALRGLWEALVRREVPRVVFLGDYINKGARSAEVLDDLVSMAEAGRVTLLAGNHETALVDALDREDLSAFLKMGGAMTIRSYVGGRVGPDVFGEFMAKIPLEHLAALRRMPLTYETDALVAQHTVPRRPTKKFCISAHVPVGDLPLIGPRSAQLDTGCGPGSGRLTALLWPTLDVIQVHASGDVVPG